MVECFAEYTDRTDSAEPRDYDLVVPHILTIRGRYENGDTIGIHAGSRPYANIIRYLSENFGPCDSVDSRWRDWAFGSINIGFTTKADAMMFMLWLRGKTTKEIIEYYD